METQVTEFVSRDQEIQEINASARPKRKRVKELKQSLAEYMQAQQLSEMAVNGEIIQLKTSAHKAPLSKDYIRDFLIQNQNWAEEEAVNLVEALFSQRPSRESISIKRKRR